MSGLNLVEVDFLHQSHPLIAALPSYADSEPGAYPYWLIVSNPHPTLSEGLVEVYGFGVDDPIPTIRIPLTGADLLDFEFGIVYNRVFESLRFCESAVDYMTDPIHPERYTTFDQAQIGERLARIRKEHPQTS